VFCAARVFIPTQVAVVEELSVLCCGTWQISRHIRGPIRPMFSTTSMGPRRAALQTLGARASRCRRLGTSFSHRSEELGMLWSRGGVGSGGVLWTVAGKRQRFPMVGYRLGASSEGGTSGCNKSEELPTLSSSTRGLCNIAFFRLS
jgi:hypothetical protein